MGGQDDGLFDEDGRVLRGQAGISDASEPIRGAEKELVSGLSATHALGSLTVAWGLFVSPGQAETGSKREKERE